MLLILLSFSLAWAGESKPLELPKPVSHPHSDASEVRKCTPVKDMHKSEKQSARSARHPLEADGECVEATVKLSR